MTTVRASALLALGFLLAAPLHADDTAAQIAQVNSSIERGSLSGAALRARLTERKRLILRLIAESPASVRDAALKPVLTQSFGAAEAALLETDGEWNGSLEVLAEMDFVRHTAMTHRYLRTAGGRAEIFGTPAIFAHTDSLGGAQLRIRGIRADNVVAVDSVQPVARVSTPQPVGVQSIAVLVVTSPSNSVFPKGWNINTIQNLFFGATGPTLNAFWQEASYGKTSATGTVYGPFALASDYTCSAPDTSDSDALRQAAIAAAKSTVDFTQYNRVAIVFPDNTCTYGGLASVGAGFYSDLPQATSIAWFPVFNQNDVTTYVRILAHEEGHNLGLNHANSEDYGAVPLGAPGVDGVNTEYGDPFSVMGIGEGGSASNVLAQYSAQHKAAVLGWLDSSGYRQVSAAGTYTVAPLETSTGVRGLRILRDPATRNWLWVESRQPIGQIDSTLTAVSGTNVFSGALVHFENPDLDPLHTYLLDFNPHGAQNNFYTAAMTAGQTWSDPFSPLHLTIDSAGVQGVTVEVDYDSPCAALASSGTVIPAAGGSGTIQLTAPSGCQWTASGSGSWLTLAPASGSGPGSVTFTAAANNGILQRNGVVSVQRQSVPIVQQGPGITGIGVTPSMGSGLSGAFAFQFADAAGYTDLDYANAVFGPNAYSGAACYLSANLNGYIWLRNDADDNWLGPVFPNKPGTSIANSSCTLYADGSSIVGSGTLLTMTVHVQFSGTVSGSLGIWGWAHHAAGYQGPWSFGQWTVAPAASSLSAAVSAASFAAGNLAPESIVALFGTGLSEATQSATTLPLPTNLASTSVLVTDSAGLSRAAPLYFVSSTQINFEVPAGTATGNALLTVQSLAGAVGTLPLTVHASAPGVFLANSKTGLPAAVTLTIHPDTTQSVANVFQVDTAGNINALPIDLSQGNVFLLMFGTGIRNAKSVTATIGGLAVPVGYAGPQGTFVGEDQINIGPLPASLAGKGSVPAILTADGQAANTATIVIK